MATGKKLLLDTDPGTDDTVALLMALGQATLKEDPEGNVCVATNVNRPRFFELFYGLLS